MSPAGEYYRQSAFICCLQRAGKHELLEKFKMAVPAFHSYGHDAACQVKQLHYCPENLGFASSSPKAKYALLKPCSGLNLHIRVMRRSR